MSHTSRTIAVIGGGNMGGAVAVGLRSNPDLNLSQVRVVDPNPAALAQLQAQSPDLQLYERGEEAVVGADYIVVAVKPWLCEELLQGLAPYLDLSRQRIISVVSGVDFAQMRSSLASASSEIAPTLFRVIPNTAITYGRSVTFIAHEGATPEEATYVRSLFESLGSVFEVSEEGLVAGTSLASCGIAFALRYLDASIRGGEQLGFSATEARQVVIDTMRGALELLERNGTDPQTEIDRVTTPGGITFRGLEAMQEAGFEEAVWAGLHKSRW